MKLNRQTNNILLLSVIAFFLLCFSVYAEPPVVFFSDMTDGPTSGWEGSETKGAAVSIWGLNFGPAVAGSKVTCAGQDIVANSSGIAEWAATTDPITARGLQRITFYLNSSMPTTGDAPNSTISVTTSEGTSSTIPFHCRAIGSTHIYFVDDDGSDSNNGLRDTGEGGNVGPWATLEKVRTVADAGDVIYCRAGIYTTVDTQYVAYKALMYCVDGNFNNGTAYNSITLTAYPGEVAQMGDGSDSVFTMFRHNQNNDATIDYWTISKFKIVVYDYAIFLTNSSHRGDDHFRIIGLDATTTHAAQGRGYILAINAGGQDSQDMRILGNYLHHSGKANESDPHGYKVESIYMQGFGDHKYVEVGWNEMYKNNGTCQFYGHTSNDSMDVLYFHNNYVHDNGTSTIVLSGGDGTTQYSFIGTAYVYNNIFSGHQGGARISALSTGGHGGNFYIYNNVFYGNCLGIGSREFESVYVDYASYKNNIIVADPKTGGYFEYREGTGENMSGDHNCWIGKGHGPSWDSNSLDDTDPQFVSGSPSSYSDFRLSLNSPCKNVGILSVSAVVKTDINGISRPQGGGYEIGAYEYNEGDDRSSPPPSDDEDPAITITTPTTAPEYETPLATISLAGMASDNVAVQSITWTQNGGPPQDATGTTDWSIPSVILVEGANNVVVTAKDTSGNPASGTIVINYTKPQGTYTKIFGNVPGSDHPGTLQDTFNNANPSNQNYSTSTASLNTYTWPAQTSANTISLKCDLRSIPSNAIITDAKLYLYQFESGGDDNYELTVHKIINHNPKVSTCNWDTYDGANSWTSGTTGGLHDIADPEDVNQVSLTNNEYKVWSVTGMVQGWILNPATNFGMLLTSDQTENKASVSSHRSFIPTENADENKRPKLVVTYTVGDDTTAPGDVSGFTATPGPGQITLTWTNPTDTDFAGVMIRYNTDGTNPQNKYDGSPIPNGNDGKIAGSPGQNMSYVHTNLDPTKHYFYSAFTYDTSNNYSHTAWADAQPLPSPGHDPVIESFTADPTTLNNPGETTTFNVSATDPDGDSLTYTIDFGDGTANGSGSQVEHTYEAEGTYTAEVTVDDGHGNTVGESLHITVDDVPPAKPTGVTAK